MWQLHVLKYCHVVYNNEVIVICRARDVKVWAERGCRLTSVQSEVRYNKNVFCQFVSELVCWFLPWAQIQEEFIARSSASTKLFDLVSQMWPALAAHVLAMCVTRLYSQCTAHYSVKCVPWHFVFMFGLWHRTDNLTFCDGMKRGIHWSDYWC